jgi:hypothetical protein
LKDVQWVEKMAQMGRGSAGNLETKMDATLVLLKVETMVELKVNKSAHKLGTLSDLKLGKNKVGRKASLKENLTVAMMVAVWVAKLDDTMAENLVAERVHSMAVRMVFYWVDRKVAEKA